jgi:hypothetical protein
MKRVELLATNTTYELQDNLQEYYDKESTGELEVIDVQYATSDTKYTAMVIYNDRGLY